jgi:hypothetical protein
MSILSISQTPATNEDYEIDWSTRGLGTDTIATSSWSKSSDDFTISNGSNTTTTTTIWPTGGIPGVIYYITNSIVTAAGRNMQETISYVCIPQQVA